MRFSKMHRALGGSRIGDIKPPAMLVVSKYSSSIKTPMLKSAWSGNRGEKCIGSFVDERREKFITQ